MTGVADLSAGRVRLRVTGSDRVEFLQGQCTNDIKQLRAGQSCYAAFLNAKGKMRGDAYIVCRDEDFLLEASTGLRESLEKFIITEDVTVEDVSAVMGAWIVIGPVPAEPITFAHPLGTGVLCAGPLPVTIDAGAFDAMRIEMGIPAWGLDMDETTIPVEAGLAKRAISYEKGCYIGQETIARIKTYGHVNRHLVQLSGTHEILPGAKLLADDREVGHVTSAAHSIRLGKTVALGYVRRELARAGSLLQASGKSWEIIKLCGD